MAEQSVTEKELFKVLEGRVPKDLKKAWEELCEVIADNANLNAIRENFRVDLGRWLCGVVQADRDTALIEAGYFMMGLDIIQALQETVEFGTEHEYPLDKIISRTNLVASAVTLGAGDLIFAPRITEAPVEIDLDSESELVM